MSKLQLPFLAVNYDNQRAALEQIGRVQSDAHAMIMDGHNAHDKQIVSLNTVGPTTSQLANLVYASPNTNPGVPKFRALVAGDFGATVIPDAALSANVPLKNATNTFSAAQTISSGGLAVTGGINAADGNLQLTTGALQSFALIITNSAGTLQHAIRQQTGDSTAGNFASKITGASTTFANTPYVTSAVDFTNGVGIDNANKHQVHFNTAAQTTADKFGLATLTYNDTNVVLVPLTIEWRTELLNVNGTTRMRNALKFANGNTGAAFTIDTTNIPSGKTIAIQILAAIK